MALKAILSQDEYGQLNDTLKAEYRADGDRYVLDVEAVNGWNLEDVGGLKSALGTERDSRSQMEKLLKQFGCKEKKDTEGKVVGYEFGDWVPDKLKKSLEKLSALEKIDPKTEAGKLAEQQIEAMRAQLRDSHAAELSEKDTRILSLESALDISVVDNEITRALSDKEVRGNSVLLGGLMKQHVKRVEKDGKFVVQVVDENGVPKVNSKADPMSVKEFALELRANKQYSGAFEGTGSAGGGGTPPGPGKPKIDPDKMTSTQRISRGLSDPATVAGADPRTAGHQQ
jgi:hypothetical protein